MKHEIELPEPKFRVGDVVERRHEYGSIIVAVHAVQMSGEWSAWGGRATASLYGVGGARPLHHQRSRRRFQNARP